MSDYATKEDVKEIVGEAVAELGGIISDLVTHVDGRFEKVDKRFDKMDKRFDAADKRFDKMDKRFDKMDKRFDAADKRTDGLANKVDSLEQEQAKTNQLLLNIEGRLEAIENDVRDIYFILNTKQDKKAPMKKLKGKNLEQYVLETYNNLLQIAKEANIKLP